MMDLDHMARLWASGKSMTEIAAMMGISRCSVAGYISRNREMFKRRNKVGGGGAATGRLFLRVETDKVTSPRANRPEKAQEPRPAHRTTKDRATSACKPAVVYEPISKEEAEAYDQARLPFAKGLLEIGPCECRWWVSEGPIMFCAEVTGGGSSWCEHHKRRLVGRGTESERKAASDLRRAA